MRRRELLERTQRRIVIGHASSLLPVGIYVSTTGSDLESGDAEHPLATIQKE
jgi:hypothetical protein